MPYMSLSRAEKLILGIPQCWYKMYRVMYVLFDGSHLCREGTGSDRCHCSLPLVV